MDCLRTDRNASDADAAMVDVGRRWSARPRVCAGKRPNGWKRGGAQRRRVDGWKARDGITGRSEGGWTEKARPGVHKSMRRAGATKGLARETDGVQVVAEVEWYDDAQRRTRKRRPRTRCGALVDEKLASATAWDEAEQACCRGWSCVCRRGGGGGGGGGGDDVSRSRADHVCSRREGQVKTVPRRCE
ncbi:hypothetical protein L1887_50306 [Cichorium endivia]|nr:hypothetical protein L1887_50306 [Cichorium endivia]